MGKKLGGSDSEPRREAVTLTEGEAEREASGELEMDTEPVLEGLLHFWREGEERAVGEVWAPLEGSAALEKEATLMEGERMGEADMEEEREGLKEGVGKLEEEEEGVAREEGLTKVAVTARESVALGVADRVMVGRLEAEGEGDTELEKEEEEVPDWEGSTPLTRAEGDTELELEGRGEREGEEDRDWEIVEDTLAEVEREVTMDWVPKMDWVLVGEVAEEALGLPLGREAVEEGVGERVTRGSSVPVMGGVFEEVLLGLEAVADTEKVPVSEFVLPAVLVKVVERVGLGKEEGDTYWVMERVWDWVGEREVVMEGKVAVPGAEGRLTGEEEGEKDTALKVGVMLVEGEPELVCVQGV